MSFDLKKFLTENKLTKTAILSEGTEPTKSSENWRDNLGPNFKIDPTSVNQPRYRSFGERVFEVDPNITTGLQGEKEILNKAYELLKKEVGVTAARYYTFYDEDYVSDIISDYRELQRMATGTDNPSVAEEDLMENKNNLKENNMSFDLKKFLTENKLTKSSRLAENDLAFEAEEMQAPVAEEPTAEGSDVTRYLNLESADDVVKEIESEVARVTMEAKIAKIKEVIEAIETKANGLEEDANLEGFVNPARIKEMRRMTKKLRMMQERYTKEYDKKYKEVKKKK